MISRTENFKNFYYFPSGYKPKGQKFCYSIKNEKIAHIYPFDFVEFTSKKRINSKELSKEQIKNSKKGLYNIQKSIKNVDFNNTQISLNDGKIKVNGNKSFEKDLNNFFSPLNCFEKIIGRKQSGIHYFTLDKHILKVTQNLVNDPDFQFLSENDKKISTFCALFHDIEKKEGKKDNSHPLNSANSALIAAKKLNFSEDEQTKIYDIIKNHHYLEIINKAKYSDEIENNEGMGHTAEEKIKTVARGAKNLETFKITKMLCKADLKSVLSDESFYNSLKNVYDTCSDAVVKEILRLKP